MPAVFNGFISTMVFRSLRAEEVASRRLLDLLDEEELSQFEAQMADWQRNERRGDEPPSSAQSTAAEAGPIELGTDAAPEVCEIVAHSEEKMFRVDHDCARTIQQVVLLYCADNRPLGRQGNILRMPVCWSK